MDDQRVRRLITPQVTRGKVRSMSALVSKNSDALQYHRRDQEPCPTELASVNACVTNDFCLQCVNVAYRAVMETIDPLCIDVVNGICPAIQSGCDCGDCVTELQDYYTCRTLTCPEKIDCSNPCSGHVSDAIFCTRGTDCYACVNSNIEAILKAGLPPTDHCGTLEEGICNAIKDKCDCGGCEPVLVDWMDCVFPRLKAPCRGGFECSTGQLTNSPVTAPTTPEDPSPTLRPVSAPVASPMSPPMAAPVASVPTPITTTETPTLKVGPTPVPGEELSMTGSDSGGGMSTATIAGAAVGAIALLCIAGLVAYRMMLSHNKPSSSDSAHPANPVGPAPESSTASEIGRTVAVAGIPTEVVHANNGSHATNMTDMTPSGASEARSQSRRETEVPSPRSSPLSSAQSSGRSSSRPVYLPSFKDQARNVPVHDVRLYSPQSSGRESQSRSVHTPPTNEHQVESVPVVRHNAPTDEHVVEAVPIVQVVPVALPVNDPVPVVPQNTAAEPPARPPQRPQRDPVGSLYSL